MYILKMYFPAAFTPFCSQEVVDLLSMLDQFEARKCKIQIITNDRIEVIEAWIKYLAPVDFVEGDLRVELKSEQSTKDFDRKTQIHKDQDPAVFSAIYPLKFKRDLDHFLEILDQLCAPLEVSKETAQPLPIDPLALISGS